jgi:hypothetical protein
MTRRREISERSPGQVRTRSAHAIDNRKLSRLFHVTQSAVKQQQELSYKLQCHPVRAWGAPPGQDSFGARRHRPSSSHTAAPESAIDRKYEVSTRQFDDHDYRNELG